MNLKEKITRGWQVSAEGYSALVQEDFQEETRRAWLELILNRAPQGKKLRILDAGTGPGFFAVILAAAGHETTGIDISSNMLMEAERNAARFGAAPRFLLMDSQSPDFPAASFDLILSRNVVWSLRKPRQAYAAWRQLLAPGGRLLVFDADYLRDLREPEFLQVCREAEAAYASRFDIRLKPLIKIMKRPGAGDGSCLWQGKNVRNGIWLFWQNWAIRIFPGNSQ